MNKATERLLVPSSAAAYLVHPPSLQSSHHGSDEESGEASAATTPIVPNLQTFNLVIATLAAGGKWKKALDVSAPMRTGKGAAAAAAPAASATGGRGVVGGRRGGRGGKGDAASRAVTSVAEGLVADAETYTHLIVACGRGGEPDR